MHDTSLYKKVITFQFTGGLALSASVDPFIMYLPVVTN